MALQGTPDQRIAGDHHVVGLRTSTAQR